jgi:hypothetical protein
MYYCLYKSRASLLVASFEELNIEHDIVGCCL